MLFANYRSTYEDWLRIVAVSWSQPVTPTLGSLVCPKSGSFRAAAREVTPVGFTFDYRYVTEKWSTGTMPYLIIATMNHATQDAVCKCCAETCR